MTNSETPPNGDVAGDDTNAPDSDGSSPGAILGTARQAPSSAPPVPSSPEATGLKPCFWPSCSDRKRCAAHGSCVALVQAGGKSWPEPIDPQVTREPLTDLENRWRFAKVDRANDYMKRLYACGDELVERIVALCAQVQHEHHVSKQWQENFQKVHAAYEETTAKLTTADEQVAAMREDVERHRDLLDKVKDDGWASKVVHC